MGRGWFGMTAKRWRWEIKGPGALWAGTLPHILGLGK